VPSRNELVSLVQSVLRDHLNVVLESPDVNLLESGLVDSVGLVELIVWLEDRLGMSLPMDALEIDDLRSVNTIVSLITSLAGNQLTRAVG
jgi:D-alanine--poly(phosphoribitol) ligase subunit 2